MHIRHNNMLQTQMWKKKQRKFSVQHNFLGWKSNTQKIEAFARWIKRFRFFFGTRNLSKLPKLKSFFFGLNDEKRHLHCRETNTSQNWFQLDYNWIWCFFSQKKKLKAGKVFPLSAFDRLIELLLWCYGVELKCISRCFMSHEIIVIENWFWDGFNFWHLL